uniref:Uncharacterized protein n=1 Tax=Nelumbo nucifera TaxID=4432 RepID=A0A822Z3D6_NELNU|nr:TPA_asm: hypothetical protein HUJ06_008842 [Nelumbo nucifera]
MPPLFFSAEALRTLHIKNCPQLTWTPFSPSPCLLQQLEELELEGDVGGFSRSLPSNNKIKVSTIWSSPFESLPSDLENLTALQTLWIRFCYFIMSIPVELQRLTSLPKLEIYHCHLLEERCKKEAGEDWMKICRIQRRASCILFHFLEKQDDKQCIFKSNFGIFKIHKLYVRSCDIHK